MNKLLAAMFVALLLVGWGGFPPMLADFSTSVTGPGSLGDRNATQLKIQQILDSDMSRKQKEGAIKNLNLSPQALKDALAGGPPDIVKERVVEAPIPLLIPCEACKKKVSKRSTACPNCGHPTPDSVVAFRKEQALVRIRTEEERQQAEIRAEEERNLAVPEEELRRAEEFDQKYGKSIAEAIDYIKKPADYTGWAKKIYDNGQIEWLQQYKEGKPDGLGSYWRENGQKKSEVNWKEGKQDGLSTGWYENGRKSEASNFKVGKLMSVVSWKPNGEKCPHTNFKDGNGVYVDYYENGQKKWERSYKNGKLEGTLTKWYENGQKMCEAKWKDGKRDGRHIHRHENGQVELIHHYQNGKKNGLFQEWYENGKKKSEETYKDGKEHGLRTIFKNGQKSHEATFKDGKKHGLWTKWYENGQKSHESTYKDGKLWTAVGWKPNGEKCPVTNVVDGNGVVVIYREDGTEVGRITFKDGEMVFN